MQTKKKSRWQFTKKQESSSTAMHSSHINKATVSSEWYQSITKLPLNKFVDVAVDNNLNALTISGFPTPEELEIAWSHIYNEYSEAMGDNESKLYVTLLKRVAVLKLTLSEIHILVEILTECYYEPFTKKLNKLLNQAYEFNPDKPEEFNKQLKSCLNRSKAFKIEMDLKQLQLDAFIAKNKEKKSKYTRQYFDNILISLSDHAGFEVKETITVYQFCERLKRLNEYNDLKKKTH
jgi:hypothetical protein